MAATFVAAHASACAASTGGRAVSASMLLARSLATQRHDPRKSSLRRLDSMKSIRKDQVLEATPETLMQSQMYTPEVLKADSLMKNCHRMVFYGLAMPELLDRYAERAIELAPTMSPANFSIILSAFAKAKHHNEQLLRTFAKHIPPKLPSFVPMSLSQTCNAYAKLRCKDEALFRRLSSEMPHKLPLFEGFQLQHVVNAYARLGIRDELLFDDIADEVMRRPEDLDAAGLVLVANAFGHYKINKPQLWHTLAEWILQSYLDLTPVDAAVALNAFSAVDYRHEAMVDALLSLLTEPSTLATLDAPSGTLGMSLNALARMRWPDAEPVVALTARALEVIDDFDTPGLTQLLHACTRLPAAAEHAGFLEALLERARRLVPECGAQSLSLMVHACATLRHRDVHLLTAIAKAVPEKVKDFTPQALAMTLSGFARLGVRSEILFYILGGEAVEKMPLFSGQGLGMLLRAYGRLEIRNERLAQACKKQVRALADELTLPELESIEKGFMALGELDPTTAALLRKVRSRVAPATAASSSKGAPTRTYTDLLQRLAEEGPSQKEAGLSVTSAGVTSAASNVSASSAVASSASASAPSASEMRARAFWRDADGGKGSEASAAEVHDGSNASATSASDGDASRRQRRPEQEEVAKEAPDPDLWALWSADGDADERSPSRREAATSGGSAVATAGVDGADDATPRARLREYLARPEGRGGAREVVSLPSTPMASRRSEAATGAGAGAELGVDPRERGVAAAFGEEEAEEAAGAEGSEVVGGGRRRRLGQRLARR